MSVFPSSVPALESLPAGRHRLLCEILAIADLSVFHEGEYLGLATEYFVEALQFAGYHVEAGDHQLVITVPQ
jgi:hypothetical protein